MNEKPTLKQRLKRALRMALCLINSIIFCGGSASSTNLGKTKVKDLTASQLINILGKNK